MADNILQRIIKLVLDRNSAKKVQDDVEETAGGIDRAFGSVAKKIAGYLGVAFLTKKIIDFGRAAVEEAMNSQAAWSDLKTTIDNTGDSFDELETHLRDTANAFQDATGKDDDAFAASLSRLITLTGDTAASMNNMGLVANVAAKFFKGELEPATQLVAKAMNGNTAALQKMGIHAKDGQEALQVLAQRSMGAAVRASQTFTGQLGAMHEEWNDVLKDFGMAIIASDGTTSAVTVLRAAIRTLNQWIVSNKDEIRLWVTNGVKFAIDASDVLIRALMLIADFFKGGFQSSIGFSVGALAKLVDAMFAAISAGIALKQMLHIDVSKEDLLTAQSLFEKAKALHAWADAAKAAGKASLESAKDVLMNPLFSSEQFGAPKGPPKKLEGETNTPMLGKNATSKGGEEVQKAVEQFSAAEKAAKQMTELLGKNFNEVDAEIERTSKLLSALAEHGIDPASVGFSGLGERLRFLVENIKPVNDVTRELAKSLDTELRVAAVTSSTGLDTATTSLDSLKNQQKIVLKGITDLIAEGFTPANEVVAGLITKYLDLTTAISDETKIQKAIDVNKELAKTLKDDVAVAALTGTDQLSLFKEEQTLTLRAIEELLHAGLEPSSDAVQKLVDRYTELKNIIANVEDIEAIATVLRDLGDAAALNSFTDGIDQLQRMKREQQDLLRAIQILIARGVKPEDEALKKLEERYKKVTEQIDAQTEAMEFQAAAADFLAEALGAALQGGLGKAAAQKAKQNAIEAAEMLVRAGVFAIFGNFPAAGAALKAAAGFGALAIAWAGLAASAGGGGGSSSPAISSSGGASSGPSSGQDLSSARTSSRESTSRSETPSTEVSIYLVGPGFHAANPAVQEVVWGAAQEAAERYGSNARIRIRQPGSSS